MPEGAAVELGADGIEVDEPALEECSGSGLERGIHPPVQLDLVIQRTQHLGNPLLLGEGWERHPEVRNVSTFQAVEDCADIDEGANLLPPMRAANKPTQEGWIELGTVSTK
jgi:hypothetical protein